MNRFRSAVDWRFGLLGLACVAALLAMEAASERGGLSPMKLLLEASELGLTVAAAVAIALMFGRLKERIEDHGQLVHDLRSARHEGERWRQQAQSHLDGLASAIRQQFDAWRLSSAESEVCLLLIKGLSHREISLLRGTSEATVRQQARAAYEKSGLKGRAALCAYFLEDLLPEHEAPASTAQAVRRNGSGHALSTAGPP